MDCEGAEGLCNESACADAGGNYSLDGCAHGGNFSLSYYENATGECSILKERCEQVGGAYPPQRGEGCCIPVFALLALLGFAVRSPRFK